MTSRCSAWHTSNTYTPVPNLQETPEKEEMQPTPSPSLASSVINSSVQCPLSTPRHKPLLSTSAKRSSLIRLLDERVQQIQRIIAIAITTHKTIFDDISRLLDIAWESNTPSILIPYSISLAGIVLDMVRGGNGELDMLNAQRTSERDRDVERSNEVDGAPPGKTKRDEKSLLLILHKLDYIFASLIRGQDVASGDPLPEKISQTEKVRIRSLVLESRVAVVNYCGELEDGESDEEEELDVGRVYELTLTEIGDGMERAEFSC
ncbi:hypothetical protein K470DRAFT_256381 [Piedraia hortae CBS 480.64]|uniref:Uncharacterized protein n=1 Tax=Piedraia hortae CBS 480.64 TaxID=1314780 RepID=A0A6A7C417_9PEZI|nr:hypothetical protein K470DRAFT_256381 [Piedraia hortae CBS 480.64]